MNTINKHFIPYYCNLFKLNINNDNAQYILLLKKYLLDNAKHTEVDSILNCLKMFHDGINRYDTEDFQYLFQISIAFINETLKLFETNDDSNVKIVFRKSNEIILSPNEMCIDIIEKIRKCENERGVEIPKEIHIDDLKDYDTFIFYILYYILLLQC